MDDFEQRVDAAADTCPCRNMQNPAYFAAMLVGCFAFNSETEVVAQEEVLRAITRIGERQRALR